MKGAAVMDSPIGRLSLEADEAGLCTVRLLRADERMHADEPAPLLLEAQRQLAAYFEGKLKRFDLPLSLRGTAFDCAVWRAMLEIPYGETRAYGDLAKAIGKPAACRAVGAACGRNPLLIVAPCHRVVSASRKLTGFAAGLEAKRTLLRLEGWRIENDRIK